jgi:isoquinoline 1-oxidoreductase beta subunit
LATGGRHARADQRAFPNLPLAAQWAPLWAHRLAHWGDQDGWLVRRWAEDHRFMATGSGTSVAAYEEPLRKAAAGARSVLAMAAAARWGLSGWEQCDVSGGAVRHGAKVLGFGELVADASRLTPPDPPVLPRACGGKPGGDARRGGTGLSPSGCPGQG